MTTQNVLIPLPSFELPSDFPWRIGFVSLVDQQLRRLRATGHFVPPRFFGYFFRGATPVGVGGSWTVSLDLGRPVAVLPDLVERATHGAYSIVTPRPEAPPDFLLIHDRRDGACWLWSYADGLRFVEAFEPVSDEDGGSDDAEVPRLLGP